MSEPGMRTMLSKTMVLEHRTGEARELAASVMDRNTCSPLRDEYHLDDDLADPGAIS